jgi:hypothetical protein
MKRIVLTLAALTFSASSVMAEDIDSYGNVLQDQVSQGSSYSSPNTWTENHGSVLLDEVADNRGSTSDIEVGDSESGLFETDAESAF